MDSSDLELLFRSIMARCGLVSDTNQASTPFLAILLLRFFRVALASIYIVLNIALLAPRAIIAKLVSMNTWLNDLRHMSNQHGRNPFPPSQLPF